MYMIRRVTVQIEIVVNIDSCIKGDMAKVLSASLASGQHRVDNPPHLPVLSEAVMRDHDQLRRNVSIWQG